MPLKLEVKENEPIGKYLGDIAATDRDVIGGNGNSYGVTFKIDESEMLKREGKLVVKIGNTGQLTSLIVFDREIKDKYFIQVSLGIYV